MCLVIVVGQVFFLHTVIGQNTIENEIIVYFSSGIEREIGAVRPSIVSDQIVDFLNRYDVGLSDIEAAFPDFQLSDYVKTSPSGEEIRLIDLSKVYLLRNFSPTIRDRAIITLRQVPGVLFAEPNIRYEQHIVPNDGYIIYQYGLYGVGINAFSAWDTYTGDPNNRIAILDCGISPHADLDAKLLGSSFYYIQEDLSWGSGWLVHGTLVGGVAAAITNNTIGIAGVDWYAKLWNEPVCNADGEIGPISIAWAIVNAINNGGSNIRVLNCSFGSYNYSEMVRSAFAWAYMNNRVTVASMGNDQTNVPAYPAAYGQGIIAVGGTDASGDLYVDTNWGSHVDVTAPGDLVISTAFDSGDPLFGPLYGRYSGTSFSAPHVSGLVSLLKGYSSQLYNDDIENLIRLGARDRGDPGWDQFFGAGIADANNSLNYLKPPLELNHYSTTGGVDMGASAPYTITLYGTGPLGDGQYLVKRHEFQTYVSFTPQYMAQTFLPLGWVRGVGCDGWTDENPNYGMGWAEIVPGTLTSSSATLRTYIYEFYDSQSGWYWYPNSPSEVEFSYTVLGDPNFPVPTAPSGMSGRYNPRNESVELEWDRNSGLQEVDYYQLERSDDYGGFYLLERRIWDPGSGDKVEWIDRELEPGVDIHRYRVKAHNSSGWGPYCSPISIWIGERPPDRGGAESAPENLTLKPNYPNPFNPTTQIKFGLPAATNVRLQIMNIRGQTVRVLVDEEKLAGWYTVTWDGKNESGDDVTSGIYLYLIEADNKKILKKMTIIR